MTSRQEEILQVLIKEYVKKAEPISSSFLAEKCGFDCSPATLRAEMMGLEKDGYLRQPHTSAGRVPTDKAYRFFVDKLLQEKEKTGDLPAQDRRAIDRAIEHSPREAHAISSGLAKTMSNLVDDFVISGLADTNEFYRMGFSNILESPEFDPLRRSSSEARERDDFFGFGNIFDEFENYFSQFLGQGPKELVVYIGRENPHKHTQKEAIIIARYPLPEGHEGVSAVIGPMRMAYHRNLSLLKYITKKMNELN
ncbi:MAG: hypothetical protein G01um101444_68 [Parcubacteria group bacterium Gr01-1014_44]|nr:MAG: hypothetical protein G01um101444_68 [Parcubacteria group bacterium Gr01-1014_44]